MSQTFCNSRNCSKFNNCSVALTKSVQDSAFYWWNFGKDEDEHTEPPINIFKTKQSCWRNDEI